MIKMRVDGLLPEICIHIYEYFNPTTNDRNLGPWERKYKRYKGYQPFERVCCSNITGTTTRCLSSTCGKLPMMF